MGAWTSRFGAGVGLLLIAACGPDDPADTNCERQAPYHVIVSALGSTLPASTALEVKHGGGQATYLLASPPSHSEILICSVEPSGTVPAADRLVCDVWVQGAVTLTLEAEGFPPVQEALSLEREQDCIVTREVVLELTHEPPN